MTIDIATIATWISTIDGAISIIGAIITATRAFTAIARWIRTRRAARTRMARRTRTARGRRREQRRTRRRSRKGVTRRGSWLYQPAMKSPRRTHAVGFSLGFAGDHSMNGKR